MCQSVTSLVIINPTALGIMNEPYSPKFTLRKQLTFLVKMADSIRIRLKTHTERTGVYPSTADVPPGGSLT